MKLTGTLHARAQALLQAAQDTPVKRGRAPYRTRWAAWHPAIEYRLSNGETREAVVQWMIGQLKKEDPSYQPPEHRKGEWHNLYRVVCTVANRMEVKA